MTIPKPVIDILLNEDDEIEDQIAHEEVQIEVESSQGLIFQNKLVIPDEQWDWTEALHFVGAHNLNRVFEGSLLNGPRTQIFEKSDSSKPAYVVLRTLSDVETFVWIEWK